MRSSPPNLRRQAAGEDRPAIDVLIDLADGEGGATGRSHADAPEIDGEVHLRDAPGAQPGDILRVVVEDADEHDLFGVPVR